MPNDLEYIVTGAIIECDKGSVPMPFMGTSNPSTKVSGILVTTDMDKIPLINIPSFVVCAITGSPCVPAPLMWEDTYPVKIQAKAEALLYMSTIRCTVNPVPTDKIRFVTSGQIPLPEDMDAELKKMQTEAKGDEGIGWQDVGEFALGFVPVVGSLYDAYKEAKEGNWGWAAFNVGMAVVDVVTLGGSSVAKGAIKGGVKAGAKALAKKGLKTLAKDAVKGLKNALKNKIDDFAKKYFKVCVFACFPAGTPVHTKRGKIPIEEIQVGDYVLSKDKTTNEIAYKRVVNAFEVENIHALVALNLGGEVIVATPEHPFITLGKEWKNASDFEVGDYVMMQGGHTLRVHEVTHQFLDTPISVYNFEVEDFHTYFVGDVGVWVHNAGVDCDKLAKKGQDLYVGTYSKSSYWNKKTGLNKTHTPHHVVQDAVNGTSHGKGVTINLDKKLHEKTRTFSTSVDKTITNLRDHLAADIKDLRKILKDAGYSQETINRQLQELIKQNKALGGFNK